MNAELEDGEIEDVIRTVLAFHGKTS